MPSDVFYEVRRLLRAIGSLWFAAALLVLLPAAMACATVFEQSHGAKQTLAVFYNSWWFETLLGLMAVNVTAAVLVRLPITSKQIGFVITHASILLVCSLMSSIWRAKYFDSTPVTIGSGAACSFFSFFGI